MSGSASFQRVRKSSVRLPGSRRVAQLRGRAGEAKVRKRIARAPARPLVLNDLSKFACGFGALARAQVCKSTQVRHLRIAALIGRGSFEQLNSFPWLIPFQLNSGTTDRQVHSDQQRVGRSLLQGCFRISQCRVNVNTGPQGRHEIVFRLAVPERVCRCGFGQDLGGSGEMAAPRQISGPHQEFRRLPALPQHDRLGGLLVDAQGTRRCRLRTTGSPSPRRGRPPS